MIKKKPYTGDIKFSINFSESITFHGRDDVTITKEKTRKNFIKTGLFKDKGNNKLQYIGNVYKACNTCGADFRLRNGDGTLGNWVKGHEVDEDGFYNLETSTLCVSCQDWYLDSFGEPVPDE